MKNRIFQYITTVWFWCGVNVIGLPEYHKHELAIYKLNNNQIKNQ